MMNNPRAATILFAILDLVLIAVFGFLYISKDRVPPVIQFQPSDLTYMETTTNDELLSGARAVDSKDGDVSDRVVIEKIVLNRTTGNAVVYYAASDYDGNVGKSSRSFPASPALFASDAPLGVNEAVTDDVQGALTGVMTTAGDSNRQPVVTEETGENVQNSTGPLMQNAPDASGTEIIGALGN